MQTQCTFASTETSPRNEKECKRDRDLQQFLLKNNCSINHFLCYVNRKGCFTSLDFLLILIPGTYIRTWDSIYQARHDASLHLFVMEKNRVMYTLPEMKSLNKDNTSTNVACL